MSNYAHPENQKLLWNILNTTPIITSFFSPYPVANKEQWFKSVIQMFYENNKNKTMNKDQLQSLNRETLSYMVQSIKDQIQKQQNNQSNNQSNNPSNNQSYSISTPPIIPDTKQEIYQQQFNNRQQEYETMFDKKAPESINFRDKVEDTAISNMDELIRNHVQQREQELKQYAPSPIIQNVLQNVSSPIMPNSNIQNNIKFDIQPEQNEQFTKQYEHINVLRSEIDANQQTNSSILSKQTERINILQSLVESNQQITNENISKQLEKLNIIQPEFESMRTLMVSLLDNISMLQDDISKLKLRYEFNGESTEPSEMFVPIEQSFHNY